jgi:phosphoglycerate kinase
MFRSIEEADVAGKRVLVRVDINVPMAGGKVTDTTRIDRVLPTIRLITEKGGAVVLLAHFGRPKGVPNDDMSLAPVATALGDLLGGAPVHFASDCIGQPAQGAAQALKPGDVLLLENLRFHAGEEANSAEFATQLALLGDIYVNEAFSVSHRAHASVEALARKLPAYAGLLMMAEVSALSAVTENPAKPVAAVVGGAKVSTKIDVLTNLVQRLDAVIIGGGMANTFLHAQGIGVGNSLCEEDLADTARAIMNEADKTGCEILLPIDAVVAREFREGAESEVCALDAVPSDAMILDVGPESVKELTARLEACRTLLWNGPLGAFEISPFGEGTFALARAAADATKAGTLTSVAGGGDTVAALNAAGVTDDFSYVSTAGGAFLEWLEGKELPGVAALKG